MPEYKELGNLSDDAWFRLKEHLRKSGWDLISTPTGSSWRAIGVKRLLTREETPGKSAQDMREEWLAEERQIHAPERARRRGKAMLLFVILAGCGLTSSAGGSWFMDQTKIYFSNGGVAGAEFRKNLPFNCELVQSGEPTVEKALDRVSKRVTTSLFRKDNSIWIDDGYNNQAICFTPLPLRNNSSR